MKKNYTVYLDEDKVEQLTNQYLQLSTVISAVLDNILEHDYTDMVLEVKLQQIDSMILETEEKQFQYSRMLKEAEEMVVRLKQRRITVIQDVEESRKTDVQMRLIRRLNSVIIANEYDEQMVEATAIDILKELRMLKSDFNLTVHINTVREILRS